MAGLVTKDCVLSILFFGIASLWSSQHQSRKLKPPETTVVENPTGEMWSTTPAEPRRHAVPKSHHRREPSWAGRPAPVEPPGDGKPRGKLRGHPELELSKFLHPHIASQMERSFGTTRVGGGLSHGRCHWNIINARLQSTFRVREPRVRGQSRSHHTQSPEYQISLARPHIMERGVERGRETWQTWLLDLQGVH